MEKNTKKTPIIDCSRFSISRKFYKFITRMQAFSLTIRPRLPVGKAQTYVFQSIGWRQTPRYAAL